MKSEAIYHLNNLIQSFGYNPQQIELFKNDDGIICSFDLKERI